MLKEEFEYLFAPYSVFTVKKFTEAAGTWADPFIVDLFAEDDNKKFDGKQPLSPWA